MKLALLCLVVGVLFFGIGCVQSATDQNDLNSGGIADENRIDLQAFLDAGYQSPVAECIDSESPVLNTPYCWVDFDTQCQELGGVIRMSDLHPVGGWMKGCFKKASDAGSACAADSDCLAGACDLNAGITSGACTLIEKIDLNVQPNFGFAPGPFFKAIYACSTPKPGKCLESILNRYNPGGISRTFHTEDTNLVEIREPGPIS
ncbi:MAG: hypothetical protein V1847_03505 [Candidatus Diapherotrites archaeon]